MSKIRVLDTVTIDKIAAGEVIERPASVVKELVENAIDAKATAIVVEIEEGGTTMIRIADNGCGIEREDVKSAFLRHSTSKIRSVEDLAHIGSLGFRGEALSSIAAVSQVELITKTKDQTFGTRYRINGGREEDIEDTGSRDGTTFLIRQLFYNVPARRKFLKTPVTEASHVGDLMTRLALSHPEISFQFINNGQSKLHSSGNGNLKDVIYHVYGRDITSNLLWVKQDTPGLKITGFLGKPVISRGNRNFENYFINGRYVKNPVVSKAIEDAYKDFSMQHKYPFVVLHMEIDGEDVDVNVHPAKMELRFHNQQDVYNQVFEAVNRGLHAEELIPHVELDVPKHGPEDDKNIRNYPEHGRNDRYKKPVSDDRSVKLPFENLSLEGPGTSLKTDSIAAFGSISPHNDQEGMNHADLKMSLPPASERDLDYFMEKMKERVAAYHSRRSSAEVEDKHSIFRPEIQTDRIREAAEYAKHPKKQEDEEPKQLNLFEEKLLTREAKDEYHLIGQVFETYWLILDLSMQEAELLNRYMDRFTRIGFEIEAFGQESYAVRAVPDNLFSIAKKELLLQMLDGLSDEVNRNLSPDLIDEKVASMSCKAAVKGNMKLTASEVDALIGELLTLENPYHCPHGRPTIIAMSRRELEKKFKRIV